MRLLEQYHKVRQFSLKICETLEIEDFVVQTIPDVSPIKWHLAHTTWFFEEFILQRFSENYKTFHPKYSYLFNSYYNSIGNRVLKFDRGQLSRPTVKEIYNYRAYVDTEIKKFITTSAYFEQQKQIDSLLHVGINHEQQHQELAIYDIKHILYSNPISPKFITKKLNPAPYIQNAKFIEIPLGLYKIGLKKEDSFRFDNEYPEHKHYLDTFKISSALVTNNDFLRFIESRCYTNPLIWLSDGWDFICEEDIKHPLYWKKEHDKWLEWTLYGWTELDLNAPVSHISYYEADAFARWKNCRLPTEEEWEIFAKECESPKEKNFVENYSFLPFTDTQYNDGFQLNGFLWEWTSSSYSPYPGYKQPKGAIGEYNGKFMINQMVLRGGSYATSESHFRTTYRNFFQPDKRWLCNGFRLVEM